MPVDPKQLETILQAHEKLTEGMASVAEVRELSKVFLGMVSDVKKHVEKMDKELSNKLADALNSLTKKVEKVKKESNQELREALTDFNDLISELQESLTQEVSELCSAVDEKMEGMDLVLQRHNEMELEMAQISSRIETQGKEIRDDIKNTYDSLKNDLNETVEKFKDEVKKIIKTQPSGRGGGTSAAGVAHAFKYIAHTEQPSGAINGVNTVYTVENNIWWIAGFTLNGEQIAELPNFTYANRTITFATALPAAYSGKDFEIKYIGT